MPRTVSVSRGFARGWTGPIHPSIEILFLKDLAYLHNFRIAPLVEKVVTPLSATTHCWTFQEFARTVVFYSTIQHKGRSGAGNVVLDFADVEEFLSNNVTHITAMEFMQ